MRDTSPYSPHVEHSPGVASSVRLQTARVGRLRLTVEAGARRLLLVVVVGSEYVGDGWSSARVRFEGRTSRRARAGMRDTSPYSPHVEHSPGVASSVRLQTARVGRLRLTVVQ